MIGALGRSGRGACDALEVAGISPLRWDLAETRTVDRDALLAADILVNTVLTTRPVPPFLVPADLDDPGRRISVVADVTCDVGSACNVLPVYDAVTDWEHPVRRLRDGDRPVDLIAIDNLPSLLPAEAGRAFSADLWPVLANLGPDDPAWARCLGEFTRAVDRAGRPGPRPTPLPSPLPNRCRIPCRIPCRIQGGRACPLTEPPPRAAPSTGSGPGCPPAGPASGWSATAPRAWCCGTVPPNAPRSGSPHSGSPTAPRCAASARVRWRPRCGPATWWSRCCPPPNTPSCCASVARRAHFACTSYTTEALTGQAAAAAEDGLVVLTEAGLDPGIDHLLAHVLVGRARREAGDDAASVAFTSYCGGLPAVPDDFRYRFSWAPYGVLAALRSPAQYIDDGEPRTARHPWEATRSLVLAGEEFEVYPNRDSLPFLAQYALPDAWRPTTFVRGTLRNAGWRAAWHEVFATVTTGDETRIRALAKELADRYPTTEADRDRVVLAVELAVRDTGGRTRWRGACLLDLTGDAEESAMARCVSVPLALGVLRILDAALPAGLNRAAESADEAARWLDFLDRHGIRTTFDDSLPDAPGGTP